MLWVYTHCQLFLAASQMRGLFLFMIFCFLMILGFLQVSAMTKIVPSPDWFVGLDSLQLCKDGHFIQSFATEVLNNHKEFICIQRLSFIYLSILSFHCQLLKRKNLLYPSFLVIILINWHIKGWF